jgi:hypothetical protein
MLGGGAPAYVKRLQSRVGDQENSLTEYKLYASKDFLPDLKREITESIRDWRSRCSR